MDLVNVAHKIRQLRQQQQLTIDQLAARSGLSKGIFHGLKISGPALRCGR